MTGRAAQVPQRPDPSPEGGPATLHASCVAADGPDGPVGVLILGVSGSGKSALALEMIARGARLVADDRVRLRREGARLIAEAPAALLGLIEARGVGLLRLPPAGPADLAFVVDLDATEPCRLPPMRRQALLGLSRPRILCCGATNAAAALLPLAAAGGRRAAPSEDDPAP